MNQNKMRAEYEAAVILAQIIELRKKSELFSAEMAEAIIRSTWLERDGERYKAPMAQMGWWAWQLSQTSVVTCVPDVNAELLKALEELVDLTKPILNALLLSAGDRDSILLADKINSGHPARYKLIAKAKGGDV